MATMEFNFLFNFVETIDENDKLPSHKEAKLVVEKLMDADGDMDEDETNLVYWILKNLVQSLVGSSAWPPHGHPVFYEYVPNRNLRSGH